MKSLKNQKESKSQQLTETEKRYRDVYQRYARQIENILSDFAQAIIKPTYLFFVVPSGKPFRIDIPERNFPNQPADLPLLESRPLELQWRIMHRSNAPQLDLTALAALTLHLDEQYVPTSMVFAIAHRVDDDGAIEALDSSTFSLSGNVKEDAQKLISEIGVVVGRNLLRSVTQKKAKKVKWWVLEYGSADAPKVLELNAPKT